MTAPEARSTQETWNKQECKAQQGLGLLSDCRWHLSLWLVSRALPPSAGSLLCCTWICRALHIYEAQRGFHTWKCHPADVACS